MKAFIHSILLLFACFTYSSGQDQLIKVNGDTINIQVIEINESFLVYHKIDLDLERIFTTHRKKLDRIVYETGEVYIFSESSETYRVTRSSPNKLYVTNGFFGPAIKSSTITYNSTEIKKLFKEYENTYSLSKYNTAKNQMIFANILSFPAGYFLGQQLARAILGDPINPNILGGAIVGSIVMFALSYRSKANMQKAADRQNQLFELTFGNGQYGTGLVLSF